MFYEVDHPKKAKGIRSSRRYFTGRCMGAVAVALVTFVLCSAPAFAQTGIARLGYRWDVWVPGGWKGIWTRRDISGAISNQYDAVWYHQTYGEIRSDIRIHIDVRDGLIITRRDITGPQAGRTCRYTGYLNFVQRTASGTFGCQWAAGPFRWNARTWR